MRKSTALVSPQATNALATRAAKRTRKLLLWIASNKDDIARSFFTIGLALREILRKKLYASIGCSSFKEMLRKHRVMSSAQAFKLISIVEHYTSREARDLGIEKASTLVRLAAATAADDTAEEIAHEGVVVDGKRRAVATLSVAALLKKAKRTRQARANARRDPARHAAEQLALGAERALRARGARGAVVLAWKGSRGWMARVECRMADLENVLGAG